MASQQILEVSTHAFGVNVLAQKRPEESGDTKIGELRSVIMEFLRTLGYFARDPKATWDESQ